VRSDLDPEPGLWVRLVARLAGRVLRGVPRDLRRVLIVRPDDRVGNALLAVPLARALASRLPDAQVDLLLAAGKACVAEGLPGLGVVRFEKRDLWRRPWRFAKWLWSLRGYDAAIDASHWHSFSLSSALLSRWASLGAVATSDRGPARELATFALPPPPPGTRDVEAKLGLLRGLGLEPPVEAPPLETALGRKGPAAPRGPYAVLNPGGRKADHRSSAEVFAALARALRDRHGLRAIVTWGPGEEPLARAVNDAELAPPTDLDGLAALFRSAALVVTNDTGPMHLAVACGAPVLALQLSVDAARWIHPGPRFRGVSAASIELALEAAAQLLSLTKRAPAPSLAT